MASSLLLRTALSQIEQAIHRVIRLKLQKLLTTVANPTALRGIATLGASGSDSIAPFAAVYVTSLGYRVEWSPASSATDNGTSVFRPSDRTAAQRGRWLLTTSTVTSGYLKSINFWDGETNKQQFQSRIFAERPSVAIVWEQSQNEPRSNVPGAIYDYISEFSVWCIDENMRPRYEAFFGSDLPADSDHPGVIAIIGDVKKALADENKREVDQDTSTSGPLSLCGGVKLLALGTESMEDADLDGRVMVMSLGLTVYASVENQDSATEHVAVTSVYVDPHFTKANATTEFDANNYVVTGFAFDAQTGLTATPTAGSAVVNGALMSGAPAAHTFTEYTDTYHDISSGAVLTYSAVANDFAAPAVASGSLRVGRVVTDSVGITLYQPIAAVSAPFLASGGWRVIPDPGVE